MRAIILMKNVGFIEYLECQPIGRYTTMNVKLIQYTANARELLIFSKRTRHMTSEANFADVMDMPEAEKVQEMQYVFSTIGSSWEFISYVFFITNVTRAFTHQLVRHRVGVAFAQQAQRVGTQEDFTYMIPPDIVDIGATQPYHNTMLGIQDGYKELLERGTRPQDARGVLPTNIHTNILMKVNLRALSDILTVRLCLRAQGEFQNVARKIQRLVIAIHPWTSKVLAPNCLRHGVCKFPRYKDCPISQQFPELLGLTWAKAQEIRVRWEGVAGYDPQPTGTYADYGLDNDSEQLAMKHDLLGGDKRTSETLHDLLLLVLEEVNVPTVDEISKWSQTRKDEVSTWAAAIHLRASDHHDIVVPPKPDVPKKEGDQDDK